MSATTPIETALAAALRRPGTPAPAGVTPSGRLDVHRNNIRVGLVEALREAYPVTERLVGEAFFRAMAGAFVADHLPDSPVLLTYGAGFPAFIGTFDPAAGLPYLPDVARLERARLEAYHAADANALGPQALSGVRTEALDALRLTLHPATRIVTSPWPIQPIWETNTYDDAVRPVDLGSGGGTVLVTRPVLQVYAQCLPGRADVFIDALETGQSLPEAAGAAADADPSFDLTTVLRALLITGALAGYRLDP